MKIIFHFGAHKTASTHLQYNLRLNKRYLHKLNIAYFRFQEIPELQEKADFLARNINKKDNKLEKCIAKIHYIIEDEIRGYDAAVVSYEGCLGYHDHLNHERIYPNAAKIIPVYKNILRNHQVIPVYAVRYYDDFLKSTYRQELGHGVMCHTINDYFKNKKPMENRWSEIIELLRETFSNCIYTFTFEDYKSKWKEITLAILQLTKKSIEETALILQKNQRNKSKPLNFLQFNYSLNKLFEHIPEFRYKEALYYRSIKHIAPLFNHRVGVKLLKHYQDSELPILVSFEDYQEEVKELEQKYGLLLEA